MLAAAAVLGLSGLLSSGPASAQAPSFSTLDCKVYFKDLPQVNRLWTYRCGPVEVELERRLVVRCGGPAQCWANVTDYMRARRISFPGFGIYAIHAFGFDTTAAIPNTCKPALTFAWSPQCTVGPATNFTYVQMISVVAPIR